MGQKEIDRYAKKGRIEIKRFHDDVRMTASFWYGGLGLRMKGSWNYLRDNPGPFQVTLEANRRLIFSEAQAYGENSFAQSFKFGPLVKGCRELYVLGEEVNGVHFFSGAADQTPLIPIRVEGRLCQCSENPKQPFFAVIDRNRVKPVEFKFTSPQVTKDMDGLAQVIQKQISGFQIGNGTILDDIVDFGKYIACMLRAIVNLLFCLFRASKGVTPQFFTDLCWFMYIIDKSICKIDQI